MADFLSPQNRPRQQRTYMYMLNCFCSSSIIAITLCLSAQHSQAQVCARTAPVRYAGQVRTVKCQYEKACGLHLTSVVSCNPTAEQRIPSLLLPTIKVIAKITCMVTKITKKLTQTTKVHFPGLYTSHSRFLSDNF